MALSKLHDKCEKCKYKDSCNNKRMMACGMAQPTMQVNIVPNIQLVMQPVLRDTSMQAQTAEQLKKDFYKGIFNMNCSFK